MTEPEPMPSEEYYEYIMRKKNEELEKYNRSIGGQKKTAQEAITVKRIKGGNKDGKF